MWNGRDVSFVLSSNNVLVVIGYHHILLMVCGLKRAMTKMKSMFVK